MLKVIIAVVAVIVVTIGIVWLIDKFIPKKAKPVIHLVLWGLIFYLAYITFMSVYGEIQFNQQAFKTKGSRNRADTGSDKTPALDQTGQRC